MRPRAYCGLCGRRTRSKYGYCARKTCIVANKRANAQMHRRLSGVQQRAVIETRAPKVRSALLGTETKAKSMAKMLHLSEPQLRRAAAEAGIRRRWVLPDQPPTTLRYQRQRDRYDRLVELLTENPESTACELAPQLSITGRRLRDFLRAAGVRWGWVDTC